MGLGREINIFSLKGYTVTPKHWFFLYMRRRYSTFCNALLLKTRNRCRQQPVSLETILKAAGDEHSWSVSPASSEGWTLENTDQIEGNFEEI